MAAQIIDQLFESAGLGRAPGTGLRMRRQQIIGVLQRIALGEAAHLAAHHALRSAEPGLWRARGNEQRGFAFAKLADEPQQFSFFGLVQGRRGLAGLGHRGHGLEIVPDQKTAHLAKHLQHEFRPFFGGAGFEIGLGVAEAGHDLVHDQVEPEGGQARLEAVEEHQPWIVEAARDLQPAGEGLGEFGFARAADAVDHGKAMGADGALQDEELGVPAEEHAVVGGEILGCMALVDLRRAEYLGRRLFRLWKRMQLAKETLFMVLLSGNASQSAGPCIEIGDFVRNVPAKLLEACDYARLACRGGYALRVRDEFGGAAQEVFHSVDLTCV